MRLSFLLLVLVLCLLLATEMKCNACKKGPFKNISSHVRRCKPAEKLIRGGYDRRRADAKERRAKARAEEEERAQEARERQEALERAEAERQAHIQVSKCDNVVPA